MQWSIGECIAITGNSYFPIFLEFDSCAKFARNQNSNKDNLLTQFQSGVEKFQTDFDITTISNSIRINKLIQDLVFTNNQLKMVKFDRRNLIENQNSSKKSGKEKVSEDRPMIDIIEK